MPATGNGGDKAGAAARPAGGHADRPAGPQPRAVPGRDPARSRSSARRPWPAPRKRCAPRARSASCCRRTRRPKIRASTTCTGSARWPRSCATSPRPTARTTSSCQGERRFRVLDAVGGFPYLVARVEWLNDTGGAHPEVEARVLYLKQKAIEAITLLPQAPAELANSIQAIESPATLADTIASFLDIKPAEKQELLETTEIRERLEKVSAHLTRRVEVLKLSRQIEEQTKEAIDDRQREYVLREQLKQIQKELGEEAEGEEIGRARGGDRARRACRAEVEEHARKELKRLERMNEASGEYSMARTYLDTLLALPWSKLDAGVDRHRARARHPRRRPLRPREDQEAHPRVPRGAQAQPGGPQPDPLLRRPARRRQDLARPVDRARDRPQVPAHEPGRHARRGRDPRPPAHLHRRAAGQRHPGDPQGRHAQPGADARRDRQARPRHPGRPGLGAARGARPRAELDVPRQLPRRAVRPVEGAVHRDGEPARHDPRPAARPHGDHRAHGLHRGREGRDRASLPGAAAARGERPQARAGADRATRRCT